MSYGRWDVLRRTGRMGEHVKPALERLLPPVPAPEQLARDAQPHEVPKTAAALAAKASACGWTVRVTYARGPRTHSTTGRFLRMVDSIAVRMRRPGVIAFGFWTDGAFDGGWARNEDGITPDMTSAELTEFIRAIARPSALSGLATMLGEAPGRRLPDTLFGDSPFGRREDG